MLQEVGIRLAMFDMAGRRFTGIERDGAALELSTGLTIPDLLRMGNKGRDEAVGRLDRLSRHEVVDPSRPCPLAPSKVLGIGMNYTDFLEQASELGCTAPVHPTWFTRPSESLVGDGEAIWMPPGCDDLDYEAELVLVIGQPCYRADSTSARAAIGGFMVGNDVTLHRRALDSNVLGKFHPRQAAVGPAVVTADEIGDSGALRIRSYVNGELRQDSSTANMVMDGPAIVEALSAVMVLSPGDLIFTGTPAGCGALARPPRFLRVGDVVRVEIEGVGSLENLIVAMPDLAEMP